MGNIRRIRWERMGWERKGTGWAFWERWEPRRFREMECRPEDDAPGNKFPGQVRKSPLKRAPSGSRVHWEGAPLRRLGATGCTRRQIPAAFRIAGHNSPLPEARIPNHRKRQTIAFAGFARGKERVQSVCKYATTPSTWVSLSPVNAGISLYGSRIWLRTFSAVGSRPLAGRTSR